MVGQMSEVIHVGLADVNVAKSPKRLRTCGLGSCVGVVFYDAAKKIGGLAHIMLPYSTLSGENDDDATKAAKYANEGILTLLQKMKKQGSTVKQLKAKLVGGAQMFDLGTLSDTVRIGKKNVIEVKKILETLNIEIVAEDTGGNWGRTIELDAATGMLYVRSVKYGTREL